MKKYIFSVDEWTSILKELNIAFSSQITFSTKYKIKRLIDTLVPIVENVEKLRIEILEKYGKLNELGTDYTFDDEENRDKFRTEYLALLENKEEIEVKTLNLNDFEKLEDSSSYYHIFKIIED